MTAVLGLTVAVAAACAADKTATPPAIMSDRSGGNRAGSGGSSGSGGVNLGPATGGSQGASSGGAGGELQGGTGGGGNPVDVSVSRPDDAVSAPNDAFADTPTRAITAGPDTVITAFSGRHVYFGGMGKREVDAAVKFPAMPAAYEKITLTFNLRCPPGGCDFWDRRGFIGVVRPGTPDPTVTEILRFVTPYRLGASFTVDVTSLRPLLSGDVTLRVFIDTWVGIGHPQGAGWLVDARFDFEGGVLARVPIAVLPVWDVTMADYGDPKKPIAGSVPPRALQIPSEATSVELRSFITGHGQGNLQNCAEFCPKQHAFTVGTTRFDRLVWRNDCSTTAVPNQLGNWRPARAGWCPGAAALPWTVDVTAAVNRSGDTTVTYAPAPYENSCRPDSPACSGCALGNGCPYNDGSHTAPQYMISALLVAYRTASGN